MMSLAKNTWRMAACGLAVSAALAATCLAADEPRTTKDKIPNTTVEFTLVQLPAGKVTIKDKDGKDTEVEIKPVWLGKTEVTWDEYDVFWAGLDLPEAEREPAQKNRTRPSKPYEPPDRGWGHDGYPAGSMFGTEAKRYCEWLSKKTNHKYRLPTEAEWEYACRAGGAIEKLDKAALKDVAWFTDNSDDKSHKTAEKKPNAWGFYDMLGNVAEWVIRLDGTEAVAGGSWQDEAEDVNPGARDAYKPAWQAKDPQTPKGKSWLSNGGHIGFRLVRED